MILFLVSDFFPEYSLEYAIKIEIYFKREFYVFFWFAELIKGD